MANQSTNDKPRFTIDVKFVDLENDHSGETSNFVAYCPEGVIMKSQCTVKKVYLNINTDKKTHDILLANECIGNHSPTHENATCVVSTVITHHVMMFWHI